MKTERNNKQYFIRFLGIVALGFVVGGLVGFGFTYINADAVLAALEANRLLAAWSLLIAGVVANVAALAVCVYWILRIKKNLRGEALHEEALELWEYRLNIPLMISSVLLIANLTLFGVEVGLFDLNIDGFSVVVGAGLNCLLLCFGLAWVIAVQNMVIQMTKKLNPEKRGSVFQMDFQKAWIESCDEAEQAHIYRAGFQAYRITTFVLIALWLLSVFGELLFHTGIWAIVVIGIIYLTMTVVYGVTAMKLEKPKTER